MAQKLHLKPPPRADSMLMHIGALGKGTVPKFAGGREGGARIGKTAMLLTNTHAIHEGYEVHEDWKLAESLTNTETIPPGVRA